MIPENAAGLGTRTASVGSHPHGSGGTGSGAAHASGSNGGLRPRTSATGAVVEFDPTKVRYFEIFLDEAMFPRLVSDVLAIQVSFFFPVSICRYAV